jgi:hypothetical protein
MSMWRLFLPLLVAAGLGGGCGQVAGDCSSGTLEGNRCVGTEPGYHWTDAKASARVLRFDYRPMVSGRFTEARCRIVARYPFYEAKAVCKGVFAAPGEASRSIVATFGLSGHGSVIPDCSARWRSNPFCTQKSEGPPVPG